ncbi:hypothetical protein YC2023_057188 [Brassica napus]
MNCARAGVENQDGCKIRNTSGTQKHHEWVPKGKWNAEQSVAYSVTRTVAPDRAKTSRGCGHQWIYHLLSFCVISCILFNEMVAHKHF